MGQYLILGKPNGAEFVNGEKARKGRIKESKLL